LYFYSQVKNIGDLRIIKNKVFDLENKISQKESLYHHQVESLHSDYEK